MRTYCIPMPRSTKSTSILLVFTSYAGTAESSASHALLKPKSTYPEQQVSFCNISPPTSGFSLSRAATSSHPTQPPLRFRLPRAPTTLTTAQVGGRLVTTHLPRTLKRWHGFFLSQTHTPTLPLSGRLFPLPDSHALAPGTRTLRTGAGRGCIRSSFGRGRSGKLLRTKHCHTSGLPLWKRVMRRSGAHSFCGHVRDNTWFCQCAARYESIHMH